MATLLTIGHSNHPIERFVDLLQIYTVGAVADMRSVPFSKAQPQFNQQPLAAVLGRSGISYVYLGEELGINAPSDECYVGGMVDYTRVARTAVFLKGVERVTTGMRKYQVAMMCSEGDPLQCHRSVLLSRHVVEIGIDVQHVLPDGSLESHGQTVERMLKALHLDEADMFRTQQQAIEDAYRLQGSRLLTS